MNVIEEKCRRLLGHVGLIERWITFAAFLALIAVMFADVLSRELTGAGIIWARQMGVYANLFLTMVGIGIASAEGSHLRPRFADGWVPASWAMPTERLREGGMALFCLAFAIVAVVAVAETRALGERSAVPSWVVWPFQAVIPVVFFMACLRHGIFALFPRLAPFPAGPVKATDSGTAGVDSRRS